MATTFVPESASPQAIQVLIHAKTDMVEPLQKERSGRSTRPAHNLGRTDVSLNVLSRLCPGLPLFIEVRLDLNCQWDYGSIVATILGFVPRRGALMRNSLRSPPARVDPAVVALRRVAAESVRLREALDLLDEAGGCGRALQVAGEDLAVRRTAGQIREARDGLTVILGRLAGLIREGAVGG